MMKLSSSLLTIYMIPIVLSFALAVLLVDDIHQRQANLALSQQVAAWQAHCGQLQGELETARAQLEELRNAHQMLQQDHLSLQEKLRQAYAYIQNLEQQMQDQSQPEVEPQATPVGETYPGNHVLAVLESPVENEGTAKALFSSIALTGRHIVALVLADLSMAMLLAAGLLRHHLAR